MLRWLDVIGFAGTALVVLGTLFLFPSSADRMTWVYGLEGLVLWCAGFASVVGWLLLRWSAPPRSSVQKPPTIITSKPANERSARQAS